MTRLPINRSLHEISLATRTSIFRFSLLFTLIASIVTGLSMVLIYQTARQEIFAQVDARLLSETLRLRREFAYRTALDFYTPPLGVTYRAEREFSMLYCITHASEATDQIEQGNTQLLEATNVIDLCHIYNSQTQLTDEQQNLLYTNVSALKSDAMRVAVTSLQGNYKLILGYNMYSEQQILNRMLTMVYIVTAILVVASFLGSFAIGYAITRSTARISRITRRIVNGDFSQRIRIRKKDYSELQSLAGDLNHMLDKIENLITSQRQVTNNIAHDLRSPLNRLRNRMEVSLLDTNRSAEELREVITLSIEDAENLLQTFNALLSIAQIESRARDDFDLINISQVCDDLTEMYEVITEDGQHTFISNITPDLQVIGNRQLIAQAITNLLDNAVKYTPSRGTIYFKANRLNHSIVVSVSDDGYGIPEEDKKRVLKQFVRLDNARSTPGNGLGLSLVSAIVSLHNATIELHDNHPGLRIDIKFPDSTHFNDHRQSSEQS